MGALKMQKSQHDEGPPNLQGLQDSELMRRLELIDPVGAEAARRWKIDQESLLGATRRLASVGNFVKKARESLDNVKNA